MHVDMRLQQRKYLHENYIKLYNPRCHSYEK